MMTGSVGGLLARGGGLGLASHKSECLRIFFPRKWLEPSGGGGSGKYGDVKRRKALQRAGRAKSKLKIYKKTSPKGRIG